MALLEASSQEILLLLFVGAVSSIGYLLSAVTFWDCRRACLCVQSCRGRNHNQGVLHSAALLIPAFIVSRAAVSWVTNEFVLLVLSMWSLVATITPDRLLDVVVAVYNTFPVSQRVPITGYVQIVKIAPFVFAVVIGFLSWGAVAYDSGRPWCPQCCAHSGLPEYHSVFCCRHSAHHARPNPRGTGLRCQPTEQMGLWRR